MSAITDQLSYIAAMAPPVEAGVKQPQKSRWMWATVTQRDPLRIRLESDSAALPITPDTLVQGLQVNQRVWVQLVGRDIIVTGVADDRTWTNCIVRPTFAGSPAGKVPQVIRRGGVVYMQLGIANTGLTASGNFDVVTIPDGFRPPGDWVYGKGRPQNIANGDCGVIVKPDGTLQVNIGATLSSWYQFQPVFWPL